jgi:hypothetical protein
MLRKEMGVGEEERVIDMRGEKFNIVNRMTGRKGTATKEAGLWWLDGEKYDLMTPANFNKKFKVLGRATSG